MVRHQRMKNREKMKVDIRLLATRVGYDSQLIRTKEMENSKIASSTINYSFFQKEQLEKI